MYRGCSTNGNPKWYLAVKTRDGETLRGVTATDASIGYDVSDYVSQHDVFSEFEFTYHITPKGNIIFDQMF